MVVALFWPADMTIDVQSFSNGHIDSIIDHGVDDTWRFMGFMETLTPLVGKTLGLLLDP